MQRNPIRTFSDAIGALEHYYPFGQRERYTLDRMFALLEACGNPQNELQIIHVAGTSGKTSTAYYAAALVHANGFKTGLTVSPHVVQLNDRVQINGTPLPEMLFCAELDSFLKLIEQSHLEPSYFELMMAFAFWEFVRQQVDCAVVEVGLGGLMDSSNTIDRQDKICVITDIGLDHTHILGDTLSEIATQKAGIIGLHNTVLCFQQNREVAEVIRKQASIKQADLHVLADDERAAGTGKLPLFQRRNYTLALAAAEVFCQQHPRPLSAKAREQALQITIPGRIETKQINGSTVIIDGAHNQQKIAALIDSVKQRYPGRSITALVAFMDQPEAEQRMTEGLSVLQPAVSHLIVTSFGDKKDAPHTGIDPRDLVMTAQRLGFSRVTSETDPERAFKKLLAGQESIKLVVGSFYLLNHIRPLFLSATSAAN